ncbi:MAG: DUF3987 domain-containing protein [Polyangiaceae bacterium]|nr:DUF3987 domain-containing protein [Polyangiaceae bacterium]
MKPVARRLLCSDATIEGLVSLLEIILRGLISAHDELSGWFRAMSQYKSRRGSDIGQWLSMHSAGPVVVDRKGTLGEPISVRRAAVCLIGGIQPGVLRECVAGENWENGLFARFLLVQPPRIRRKWTDEGISPETAMRYAGLLKTLWALEFNDQSDGSHEPIELELTPNAKSRFVEYFEELAIIQHGKVGFEASAWAKLEGYFARFALIIHTARRGEEGADALDREPVSLEAIEAAYKLVRWFGRQLDRVLERLEETDQQAERRQLLEYIENRGSSVTVRELVQGVRQFRSRSSDAREALKSLAEDGLLRMQLERTGTRGPQTARYYLVREAPSDEGVYGLCAQRPESETCRRRRAGSSTRSAQPGEEWGALTGSPATSLRAAFSDPGGVPSGELDHEEPPRGSIEDDPLGEGEEVSTSTGFAPGTEGPESVDTRRDRAETPGSLSGERHSLRRYPSSPCSICEGTCFHWLEGSHEPVCSECDPPQAHDRVLDATVLLDEEVA